MPRGLGWWRGSVSVLVRSPNPEHTTIPGAWMAPAARYISRCHVCRVPLDKECTPPRSTTLHPNEHAARPISGPSVGGTYVAHFTTCGPHSGSRRVSPLHESAACFTRCVHDRHSNVSQPKVNLSAQNQLYKKILEKSRQNPEMNLKSIKNRQVYRLSV